MEEIDEVSELKECEVNHDIFLPVSMKEYEVFDTPEGYKGYFPPSAVAAHGCMNCAWRGTHLCPYKFEAGEVKKRKHPIWTGLEFPENIKVSGICSYKKNYLILLSGEWETRPTYDMWQSRLMKNKGVIQNSRDELRYLKAAKEVEILESEIDEYVKETGLSKTQLADEPEYKSMMKQLAALKRDYSIVRGEFMQSWSMLEGFFEKGVDRETPKQVKMNITRTPTMQEIQASIKQMESGEIKDADFEVIDEEDKDA